MSDRLQQLHTWLQNDLQYTTGYELTPASEDASFRRYYRLQVNGESRIVMDAPPEHERCEPFISLAGRLLAAGVNVPRVLASDSDAGFVLLTDLGKELYLQALTSARVDDLYGDALSALLRMQQNTDSSGLPLFDAALLRAEMQLFVDWLLDRHLGIALKRREQQLLNTAFDQLLESALAQPQVFVHRDYHSRNLMVTTDNNPGILDFQDAVLGPLSYDLVSLLKDCYIKWPRPCCNVWAEAFHARLPAAKPELAGFLRDFDLMGVQRHLKASGIFARLCHRDNKHGFLKDIPRTLSYIVDLQPDYPQLQFLCRLLSERVLPALAEKSGDATCAP